MSFFRPRRFAAEHHFLTKNRSVFYAECSRLQKSRIVEPLESVIGMQCHRQKPQPPRIILTPPRKKIGRLLRICPKSCVNVTTSYMYQCLRRAHHACNLCCLRGSVVVKQSRPEILRFCFLFGTRIYIHYALTKVKECRLPTVATCPLGRNIGRAWSTHLFCNRCTNHGPSRRPLVWKETQDRGNFDWVLKRKGFRHV
jgi:hypothetical protein